MSDDTSRRIHWCGECATGSRKLTDSEAERLLREVVAAMDAGVSAVAALDAVSGVIQLHTYATFKPCTCSRATELVGDAPDPGFWLYRIWDSGHRLLYVGITTQPRHRLHRHLGGEFGDLIDDVTWEAHPTRRAMLEAERTAIAVELPAFNRAGV